MLDNGRKCVDKYHADFSYIWMDKQIPITFESCTFLYSETRSIKSRKPQCRSWSLLKIRMFGIKWNVFQLHIINFNYISSSLRSYVEKYHILLISTWGRMGVLFNLVFFPFYGRVVQNECFLKYSLYLP